MPEVLELDFEVDLNVNSDLKSDLLDLLGPVVDYQLPHQPAGPREAGIHADALRAPGIPSPISRIRRTSEILRPSAGFSLTSTRRAASHTAARRSRPPSPGVWPCHTVAPPPRTRPRLAREAPLEREGPEVVSKSPCEVSERASLPSAEASRASRWASAVEMLRRRPMAR